MKKCPFCYEEISDDAIYCSFCKEKLIEKSSLMHTEKHFIQIVIATIILMAISVGIILGSIFYEKRYNVDEIPYKSISYTVTDAESLSQKYSAQELLNKIIEQEEELSEYMQGKHSVKEKTGVFYLYYKNLKLLTDTLNYYDYSTGPKVDMYVNADSTSEVVNKILSKNLKKYQIGITPIYDKSPIFGDNMADYFKISYPKTDILEIIYEGELSFGFHINDSYIADSYMKDLNKSWQDYMNNKKRIYDDLEHNNYFDDGVIIPDSSTVAQWAIMWSDFLKKYPKFELKDEIKADIDKYSNDILYRAYKTIFKDGKAFLAEEIREGCEYYLKHADKNTEIYKKIQKDYKIWKDNDFEYNDNTNNL